MDFRTDGRRLRVILNSVAFWALTLSGCGPGIDSDAENDASQAVEDDAVRSVKSDPDDMSSSQQGWQFADSSDATPLLKQELQSILPFSRFAPWDEKSLLSSLLFRDDNKIVFASPGEAITYDIRYFKFNDANICVYDDQDFQELHQCLEFFEHPDDLFQIRFVKSNGTVSEEIYARYPNP